MESLSKAAEDAGFEVISTYTDTQAVEDGVLVDVGMLSLPRTTFGGRHINRVTRTIWTLAEQQAILRGVEPGMTMQEIVDRNVPVIVDEMVTGALRSYDRGWYTGEWNGERVWLIPNDVEGYTLMVPSDY